MPASRSLALAPAVLIRTKVPVFRRQPRRAGSERYSGARRSSHERDVVRPGGELEPQTEAPFWYAGQSKSW